jgi:hypothetical protein
LNNQRSKNFEIALIAVSVAMLIGGGLVIYMVSAVFPIPGAKYVMMAPVIASILYVLQMKLKGQFTILKFGGVFALVMTLINLFMGIAIIITALLTHLSIKWMKGDEQKAFWGGLFFAGYTGLCALAVTKAFIPGLVDEVPYVVFFGIGALCMIFALTGTTVAKRVLRHISGVRFGEDRYN